MFSLYLTTSQVYTDLGLFLPSDADARSYCRVSDFKTPKEGKFNNLTLSGNRLIPLLQKNATNTNPGRVINISSVASLAAKADGGLSAPGHGAWTYHVSKAAANHLTSTLAATLGPKFITCNAILPGIFPSKMSAFGIKEHGDALRNAQPMKRFGTPEVRVFFQTICRTLSGRLTWPLERISEGSAFFCAHELQRISMEL